MDVRGVFQQISQSQKITLERHVQARVIHRAAVFLKLSSQLRKLQPVGVNNGPEILLLEAGAENLLARRLEIEEEERGRNDQN